MNAIVKDIEDLKSESSLNYRFYSEILTVKDLLENHKMDYEPKDATKKFESPKEIEIYSQSKYSKKLSRREALVSISNSELKLSAKIELIVKHLGIVYEDSESEVLSIAAIDNNDVMYGLMVGTISNVELSSHSHQIVVHGKSRVYKIAPSKDLTTAMITGDTQIHIMSMATKKYIKSFVGHNHWILTASVSDDNKWFLTGSCDRTIKVWDHNIYKEKFQLQGHTADIWAVLLSSSNKYIVSAGEDKTIILWNFNTNEKLKTFVGHTSPIYSVQVTKNEDFILSASGDGTIRVWDIQSGLQSSVLEHKGMVRSILLIKKDKVLLSIGGNSLKVWDLTNWSLISQLNHTANLISLAVSKDEKLIFTGDVRSRLWIWDLDNLSLKTVFGGAKSNIKAVEISEDFQFIAIAESGIARIWNIEKLKQVDVLVSKLQAEKWKNVLNVDNIDQFLE